MGWEVAFMIPEPTWSGFCLGIVFTVTLLAAVVIIIAAKKTKKPKEEGIPFEEIESLRTAGEEELERSTPTCGGQIDERREQD